MTVSTVKVLSEHRLFAFSGRECKLVIFESVFNSVAQILNEVI